MDKLIDSIVKSLDGKTPELYTYLPYLLQDIWEIGSSSEQIIRLIKKNKIHKTYPELKVLDLGCGKGAVSIPVAKAINAKVLGIDGMPQFIEIAKEKSKEWGVEQSCAFTVDDIRIAVGGLKNYNLVVICSVGPVLGNLIETLKVIENSLTPEGYVILDDAYRSQATKIKSSEYLSEKQFFDQIALSNFMMVDSRTYDQKEMEKSDSEIYKKIEIRAKELVEKFPKRKALFESYLRAQREENYILENEVINITLLLKKKLS